MARRCTNYAVVCVFWIAVALIRPAYANSYDKKLSLALGHYITGVMHENLGDIDSALREYRYALKADKKAIAIRLHVAASLIKKSDFNGAIRELNLVVRLEPEAVEPHAILALLYASQNQSDLAAAEYERALKNASKREPGDIDIYKSLGVIYLRQKKFKEAEQVYRFILEGNSKDAEPHYYLASIYYEQKNTVTAEKELRAALALLPDYGDALNFLGYLFIESGRNMQEAETLIHRALEQQPQNGAYIDSLGWLYFKQGKYAEAVRDLERAAVLMEDPVIFDHLGDAYFKTGDIQKARESWQKSLKLDPVQNSIKDKLKPASKKK